VSRRAPLSAEKQSPKDYFSEADLEAIVRSGRALAAKQLMPGSQGNISIRNAESGLVAITPHALAYDLMSIDDLVVLGVWTGERVAGHRDVSFELPTHLTVYRERVDVHAVIHTEPSFVNVFGALGQEIPPVIATGLKSAGGSVPLTPFTYRRDEEFAREMLAVMGTRHAVIWSNHGLVVVGRDLDEALERTYGVEENAKVFFLASLLGKPATLQFIEDLGMIVA
jgi:L-fuculose-phosphate aldolase